ncbi:cyclase [Rhodococcus sp. 05-2256-B2]|uniref:cyclase family protein n=1 Tax=Nocardiaceae TaxID=85025 RepID=UPI00050C9C8C|nr:MULTISPECIES: cyclase family protein [Rhodococcus]MBY4383769.1 cyclase family protein [Rhodococcus fascians]MBY4398980.1 cyclase family protein [Rhodococcus fascians]MBY4408518.1 cyclase family protein [Rhodococcus fascians]MBY4423557.1 cyclase family protein [Rhodococcus fascians]MBY4462919.1 cyclase family protein [Rhodococcus fascians]
MSAPRQSGHGSIEDMLAALSDGRLRVVDLTNELSSETPTLTLPEPFSNLIDFSLEEVSAFDDSGPLWRHNNIHTGEHIGTHLDAPRHWISNRDGAGVSEIPVGRLVGPAQVIDISEKVKLNPDYLLEVDDLLAWEAEHGPLLPGSWLLVRSGWDEFARNEAAFLNVSEGVSHTPGISAAAARWLAEQSPIVGYGVETVGIDAGNAFVLEPPMPAHHFLLEADKYGVTSLQNLASLPATGAAVIVSPLPIVGGTGSPARVLAIIAS